MKQIVGVLLAVPFAASLVVILFFALFNGIGLLLGFETRSEMCVNYKNNEQSNVEYYVFPVTPYACSPKGGLLQPGVKNFFQWLESPHKD